jgi:hypothetical protein
MRETYTVTLQLTQMFVSFTTTTQVTINSKLKLTLPRAVTEQLIPFSSAVYFNKFWCSHFLPLWTGPNVITTDEPNVIVLEPMEIG